MQEETQVEKPKLLGMIWSPSEQFERIRELPKIWGALIIVTIITMIVAMAQAASVDVTEFADIPGVDADSFKMFSMITAMVTGIFIPVFSVLILSAIYLLIAKIVRSEVSFKQLFSLNTYLYFISALGGIVNALVSLLVGGGEPGVLYTSLSSILGADGSLGTILTNFEIFTIWGVILTAMGLERVARFSKGVAWGVAIGFFLIGILFSLFSLAINGLVGV